MSFQLRAIRLYSYYGDLRTITFEPGSLNIITGASKTGKSSLVEIVRYCLASTDYSVPIGVIRNTTRYYMLELSTPSGVVLAARQAPQNNRQSTSVMFVSFHNPDNGPPAMSALTENSNLADARDFLSRACGIEENVTDVGSGTRSSYAADIRHSLYFVLQGQNEVANPDILFHSQAEEFVPQSIRDVIPYFLGAVDREYLRKRQELTSLEREIRRLRRQIGEDNALRIASGRLQGLVREARSVGLIQTDDDPMISGIDAIDALTSALSADTYEQDVAYNEAGLTADLLARRGALRDSLMREQNEASNLRSLLSAHTEYNDEANEQRVRLTSLNLLRLSDDSVDAISECPVCSSTLSAPLPSASTLYANLRAIDADISTVQRSAPRVQSLLGASEDRIQSLSALLRENQAEIDAASAAEERLEQLRDLALQRANVRGRIGLFLESVNREAESALTESSIVDLERRAEALRLDIDPDETRARVDSSLSRVASTAMSIARELGAEYSQYPGRLDLRELSLIIDTDDGPRRLNEIGSGANWVAYHLAVSLAFQEYFIANARPVPRLLILDQPSQVYFPSDAEENVDLADEDRAALSRYFEVVLGRLRQLNPTLQVVVLDHADLQDDWFQRLIVEKWRDGRALVPASWIR